MNKIFKTKSILLTLSFFLSVLGVMVLSFISLSLNSAILILLGSALFIIWLLTTKISLKTNSTYRHEQTIFDNRRSIRIKLETTGLYIGILLTEGGIFSLFPSSNFNGANMPIWGGIFLVFVNSLLLHSEWSNNRGKEKPGDASKLQS